MILRHTTYFLRYDMSTTISVVQFRHYSSYLQIPPHPEPKDNNPKQVCSLLGLGVDVFEDMKNNV